MTLSTKLKDVSALGYNWGLRSSSVSLVNLEVGAGERSLKHFHSRR